VVDSGAAGASSTGASSSSKAPTAAPAPKKQATVEDRKRQMAQLAAMGVAIPEEYRKEMAMVGEWQFVARHEVSGSKEDTKDLLDRGERKRKFQSAQDDEEEEIPEVRKGWGRAFKSFPGSKAQDDDIGALLGSAIKLKNEEAEEEEDETKPEATVDEEQPKETGIKAEPSEESTGLDGAASTPKEDITSTKEAPPPAVLFKKRKAKPIKEK
jgi:hypothetical protein